MTPTQEAADFAARWASTPQERSGMVRDIQAVIAAAEERGARMALEAAAKVAEKCMVMVSLGKPGEGPFRRQDRTVEETRAEIATAIRQIDPATLKGTADE